MPAEISVQLKAERWKTLLRPYCKTVRETCLAALPVKYARGNCEITVVLADDKFIKSLNRDFRGKDKPTNVLSFPGEEEHLGDIVLALETIECEADAQGKSFKDHTKHLLVHGTLHLLGYDHERDIEAQIMEEKEIKILKKLKVNNPYL